MNSVGIMYKSDGTKNNRLDWVGLVRFCWLKFDVSNLSRAA